MLPGSGGPTTKLVRMTALAFAGVVAGLGLLPATAQAQQGGTVEFEYVEVRDGTEIAISVWYPPSFHADDEGEWPTIFTMDGYGGARSPNHGTFFGRSHDYVVVYASLRGSGCSGGQFELFSRESALDGRDVIDGWIVEQPWSDGRVGISGHSYSGITGFMVAGTQPEHLEALAVSGLIGDFYRDLLFMGGIPNLGFPVVWGGVARPLVELESNLQPQLTEAQCRDNFLAEGTPSYVPPLELVGDVYFEREAGAGTWAHDRSLVRSVDRIDVPTLLGQQYQDEQTGPRGGYNLWEKLPEEIDKRLILTNGRHSPSDPHSKKQDWLDCWLLNEGEDCGDTLDPDRRVLAHFESRRGDTGLPQHNTPYATSDFPDPDTLWQQHELEPRTYVSLPVDHRMTLNTGFNPENQGIGDLTYSLDLPTEATWSIRFDEDTAVFGPLALKLHARSLSPNLDLFVDVQAHDPATGELRYLQRGMLRGSFRDLDEAATKRIEDGPHAGEIWRPEHHFIGPRTLGSNEIERFDIEVFPFGHVFRAGQELLLRLHAPPLNDPLSIGLFGPDHPGSVVEVVSDPQHPSAVLVPTLPELPPLWPERPGCNQIAGELCINPPG